MAKWKVAYKDLMLEQRIGKGNFGEGKNKLFIHCFFISFLKKSIYS